MNNNVENKVLFGALAGVGGYLLDKITEILVVLTILVMLDYLLGLTTAIIKGQWDKKIGIEGLVRKVGYIVCVLIGFLVDFTLLWLTKNAGWQINTGGFFGIATTCYLIGTEGISCINHLYTLGIPVPKFLIKPFEKLTEIHGENQNTEGEGK